MQNPKQLIENYLKNWLERNSIDIPFEVSISQNSSFGDFSTNIALVTVKEFKGVNDPRLLADKIITFLKESHEINTVIDKIEIAGAGFINFYLTSDYLTKNLNDISKSSSYEMISNTKTPQKIIVEFGDPNPFKEIHIGHLRNFCIGESFSRLLESQDNQVIRANYQGDVGLHVAKAMWGILQKTGERGQGTALKVEDLAEGYVTGAKEFDENEVAKAEIIEINKRIYAEDPELKPLWEEGRKVSLEHFKSLYKRIGVHYDRYYFESITAKKGKEIVLSHIDDKVFEKDRGAVIYRGERDGLHTRVFLTSQEYATYEGKDLALAILKNEDETSDESVILTGNEQLEYFQVMLAALKRISPELAKKTRHLTFGHVRLKEGKMSSRTGDVITATWLLDEAVTRVSTAFPEMDSATAEIVGVGAVKYSMLKFSIPSDIHFSFEESISTEGNSGPYLQYTYVRTLSVLKKASSVKGEGESSGVQGGSLQPEEVDLLRFLAQYPYHVENAAAQFAPNLLCNYLFELSQKFNLFYQKCNILSPVIDSSSETQNDKSVEDVRSFRLALTKATGLIIKNGLYLLGIDTVDKM